ncbi:RNA-directed DNA polymerase, eukaryota, reverse transcriptase zinc-binding domain protein [Tanacetum coccineum]
MVGYIGDLDNLKNQGIDLLGLFEKKIVNGLDTPFWEEAWKGEKAFKILYPRIYVLEICKQINIASKLAHDNLGFSLSRIPRSGADLEQFNDMSNSLVGFQLPNMNDRWFWSLSGSGGQKIRSTTVIILVTGADNGSVCGPAHDESMIVEILELKDDITDSVSATWFLQDLAIGQSAEGSIVSFGIQVEIMKSDLSELKSSAPLYGGSNELLFDALSDALAFDLPVTSNLAKGTTTVAFIFKDGVMVAVHSRASMGRYMSYGQCINFTKSMFSPKTPSHLQNEFFNRLGVLLMEASLVLSTNNQLTAELLAIRSACRLALTYGWQNAIVESDCNVDI